MFDGHLGNLASKYAASSFYQVIDDRLSNIDNVISSPEWKNRVQTDVEKAFEEIHLGIMEAISSSPGGVMDQSGKRTHIEQEVN